MRRPHAAAVLRVCGALALIASIAASSCSGEATSIRIGAIYPLNGSQGPGGIDEFRGVQLAADLVNADGGVGGRDVQLEPIDVPSSDGAAAAVAQLDAAGIELLVGSYGSTISLPAADEAARRGMVFWETGAVGEMTGRGAGELVFRVPADGGVLGRQAIRFVADELAPGVDRDPNELRFAVVNVDDVYGRAVAAGALDELDARGLHLVGTFDYDETRLDAARLIADVARARPDVVFVSAYLTDGVAIQRQIARQRLPLVAAIGTSSSYCMPEFGAALGRDAIGTFASDKPDAQAIDPTGLTAEGRTLLARAAAAYEQRFDEPMSAPALTGFSGAWALLHEVLPAAGSPTPAAVGEAARTADLPAGSLPNGSGLAFGRAGTPDAGTNLRAASVIWQWLDPDEHVVVWPAPYATDVVDPSLLSTR
ncbi:MAG: ABC transporter substrate-binding protein [Actinomycetota bacterium]